MYPGGDSNELWAFIVGTYVIRASQRAFLEKKKSKLSSLRLKSHDFTKHLIWNMLKSAFVEHPTSQILAQVPRHLLVEGLQKVS